MNLVQQYFMKCFFVKSCMNCLVLLKVGSSWLSWKFWLKCFALLSSPGCVLSNIALMKKTFWRGIYGILFIIRSFKASSICCVLMHWKRQGPDFADLICWNKSIWICKEFQSSEQHWKLKWTQYTQFNCVYWVWSSTLLWMYFSNCSCLNHSCFYSLPSV